MEELVISMVRRQRQKHIFQANLGYLTRPSQKKEKKKKADMCCQTLELKEREAQ